VDDDVVTKGKIDAVERNEEIAELYNEEQQSDFSFENTLRRADSPPRRLEEERHERVERVRVERYERDEHSGGTEGREVRTMTLVEQARMRLRAYRQEVGQAVSPATSAKHVESAQHVDSEHVEQSRFELYQDIQDDAADTDETPVSLAE
jgi:hypothetical protein